MVYGNLIVALAKANITKKELVKKLADQHIYLTDRTLANKMKNETSWKLGECVAIKEILNSDLTIDELFKYE